jgi:HSP20 family protein
VKGLQQREEFVKMSLIRWNPSADLMSLHSEMDRLFNEVVQGAGVPRHLGRWAGDGAHAYAAVDVYRSDDAIVVETSVPGFSPDEVSVSFEGEVLTIDAQHEQQRAGQEPAQDAPNGRSYLRQERYAGRLHRQLALGPDLDTQGAQASFANGVLTVRIPVVAKPQPRRIPVTVATATGGGS